MMTFFHKLFSPLAKWHTEYRSVIVADWLEKNNSEIAEAIELLRRSRASKLATASRWEKKRARRKALRKLRTVCSDDNVRIAIQKRFPPLPGTWS
jgi:hypothetical protein